MNQNAKTKRPFPYVAICLIVIAVLICAVLLFHVLDSVGVVGKLDKAVVSQNYSISANELAVYEYQVGLSQLANQFWYYQYGLMEDTNGYTKVFSDAYEYAYYMLPNYIGTGAFADQAYAYAQQYVVYCEGARDENKIADLQAEIDEEVNTYMADLKTTAESGNMSLRTFIKTYIGQGISESEVRSAMEKYTLGYKFANLKNEEFSDAVEDSEMTEYLNNNKSSFYKNYYHSYVLVNNSLKEEAEKCTSIDELKVVLAKYMVESKFDDTYKTKITDAKITDPNGAEATEKMVLETLLAALGIKPSVAEKFVGDLTVETEAEADKASAETEAATEAETEAATEAETKDETEAETEAATEAETKDETETGAETEDKEEPEKSYKRHFSSSDTDAYKKAAYQVFTTIQSSLTTEVNKITRDATIAYADLSKEEDLEKATALQKWMFGGEGKAVGNYGLVEEKKTSSSSTTTTTYTWCLVTKVNFYDQEKTKDAYYVKLTDDKTADGTGSDTSTAPDNPKTAEQKANEFFSALEADKTVEKFDELAVKFGCIAEGGSALKESITESSATSIGSDFSKWLYSDEREAGNITKIKIGSSYYIAYFVEENEETWKVNARSAIAAEELDTWYQEALKKFSVEVDTKAPAETETEHVHEEGDTSHTH